MPSFIAQREDRLFIATGKYFDLTKVQRGHLQHVSLPCINILRYQNKKGRDFPLNIKTDILETVTSATYKTQTHESSERTLHFSSAILAPRVLLPIPGACRKVPVVIHTCMID